jgi:asparagine synthase (glutamine-hydrolysing)
MCGIAGTFAYRTASVEREELARTQDHMAARGPDSTGTWFGADGRIGLAHRRLSIIDLSDRASQPMLSADGKLAITFNGEIYNYQALLVALEARGRVFRSRSDTEVLLHLYAEKGEAMVHDLRGMYAFALWDADKQALLLARDPYGIKPLYYSDDGRSFRFGSQVKALLAGGGVSRTPDPAGWTGFFLFGSVPEPYTTYAAVRAMPAGTTLWVDRAGVRAATHHFSIAAAYREAEQQPSHLRGGELREYVRETLLDSVRHHLVADVPVGAFLSAGVDSGALVGLMRDAGQCDLKTITLAFEEFREQPDDERTLAAKVAELYGTRHTTRVVTREEFQADLPKILAAMDQPTIDGINTWFVSKAAHEVGLKIAISGLGGDELLGGYPSFRQIPRWISILSLVSRLPLMRPVFEQLVGHLKGSKLSPKAAAFFAYGGDYPGAYLLRRAVFMPEELSLVMDQDMVREGLARLQPIAHIRNAMTPESASGFAKVATLEASLYMRNQLLRDADWASMAHSLEVRVPLVDATLLRKLAPLAARLRAGEGKRLLAASPQVALPKAIVERAKTGFSTPLKIWIERDDRLRKWKKISSFASAGYPWARRWAYEVAKAQGPDSIRSTK